MAIDVYIKFGNDKVKPEDPDIEGDSSDDKHWFWCELRSCDLDMEGPPDLDEESEAHDGSPQPDSPGKNPVPPKFRPVTLRKRLDWASPQLFQKCCDAGMNS